MHRIFHSIAIIITLAVPGNALAREQTHLQTQLTELLQDFIEQEQVAGGVVLITDGEQRLIATAGLADRSTGAPVTPQTRFYAASVGKMLVAAAILSAVDDGLLSLAATIGPYLEDLPNIDQLDRNGTVKISQLLNHTSGLPEYLTDAFFDATYEAPQTRWSVEQAIQFAYGAPAGPANRYFEYTNTNYILLGHILAHVDGSLENSLTQRVLAPANMGATSVGLNPATMAPVARGYDEDGNDVSAIGWNSVLGDGPVLTTPGDLASFMQALFEGDSLLSARSVSQMQTGTSHDPNYGLGLVMVEDEHGRWVGHSGGFDGFEANVFHNLDAGVTLVVMINGNQSSDQNFLGDLVTWYFN